MNLQDFTKEEILEAIDVLAEFGEADAEMIYSERSDIIDGPEGDKAWDQCCKYRQPLIDYIYRNL